MSMNSMLNAQSELSHPRVLLVDDHEIGRKSLARLLTMVGFDVTDVNDGTSAFRGSSGALASLTLS